MSAKLLTAIGLVLCLWAMPVGFPVLTAEVQDAAPGADANCLACHRDLYYLYDTGNWHCLCAASPSCVCCHGGRADATQVDLAHAGMVANPLQENAATCQTCHPDEYQQRVADFVAVAGGTVVEGRGRVYPTPGPEPTRASPPAFTFPAQLREPWRLAALGLIALVLTATGGYGLYCCGLGRPRRR